MSPNEVSGGQTVVYNANPPKPEKPVLREFGPGESYSKVRGWFVPSYKAAWAAHQKSLEDQKKNLLAYHDFLKRAILERSNCLATITVANRKGGSGKTPVACYVASELTEDCRRSVVFIENAEMGGTAAVQFGLPRARSMTVRDTVRLIANGRLTTASDYTSSLLITEHGVYLLPADTQVDRQMPYLKEHAVLNIETAGMTAPFVLNDTGAHIDGSAMEGVLAKTNVLIVPTLVDKNSMRAAVETMENFRSWGHEKLVERAIVVVLGIPAGAVLEEYRQMMGLSDSQLLFGIPYDQRGKDYAPVDLNHTDLYVRIAYAEVVYATLIVARAWNETYPEAVNELAMLHSGRMSNVGYEEAPRLPWVDGSNRLDI